MSDERPVGSSLAICWYHSLSVGPAATPTAPSPSRPRKTRRPTGLPASELTATQGTGGMVDAGLANPHDPLNSLGSGGADRDDVGEGVLEAVDHHGQIRHRDRVDV